MRIARRVLLDGTRSQYFHVISRVVDRRMVFEFEEKEKFRMMMRQFEAFSGCEVVTYCVMTNHFHILVRVPVRPAEISEQEVLRRMAFIYTDEQMSDYERQLSIWKDSGAEEHLKQFFDRMRHRMFNLSIFVKDLKQKFTKWFNANHARKGTLWEERFKSLCVEGRFGAILLVAAYIDLNPVRAGIVQMSEKYRWCGAHEIYSGDVLSRKAIAQVYQMFEAHGEMPADLGRCAKSYFDYLGLSVRDIADEGLENPRNKSEPNQTFNFIFGNESVSDSIFLRNRFRVLTDSVVIGSREFVSQVFEKVQKLHKAKRPFKERPVLVDHSSGVILGVLRRMRGKILTDH